MSIRNIISSVPIEATGMMMHIIYIGLSFFIGVILARHLGPEMFGNYSYLLAWLALATSLVTAGLPTLLIREIAAYRQMQEYELIEGIFRVASILVILFSGVSIAGVLVAELFGQMQKWSIEVIFAGLLSLLFLSLTSVYESATRGLGNVLVGQLANKIVRPVVHVVALTLLVLGLGFYNEAITIKAAMYAFTFANLAGFLVAFFILRKKRMNYVNVQKKYDFGSWYSGFWRMSILGWMGALNLQLSVILLGLLGGEVDVAKYRVAAQIAMLIPFGLTVVNTIQMPSFSKLFGSGDKAELQRQVARGCTISLLTAFPILLATVFFGEEIILLLFGSGYQGAGILLLILSLGQLINVSAGSSGVLMLASHKEHTVMLTQGAVLVLNSILCIILIPELGAMGAAMASAISLTIRNTYLVFFIYRSLGIISLPGFYKSN